MRVRPLRGFNRDFRARYRWKQESESAIAAEIWADALRAALAALAASPFPEAHALTQESDRLPAGPYRAKTFGVGKKPTHRIVFRVAANELQLVALRHLAQEDLTADEV